MKLKDVDLMTLDRDWWTVRAWVIASDHDLMEADTGIPMGTRLWLRRN